MRLLHTSTLKLVSVPSHDPPPYAILSHTWGPPEDEVLYEDIVSGPRSAKKKASFLKVQHTCEQARKDDLEYCWIDTCCIDKSSSAELQEAINSMFAWYQKAMICYVYLSDVTDDQSVFDEDSQFHRARWFTRGWTLQELIAPSNINFYTRDWIKFGTKFSLASILESITKIPLRILSTRLLIKREIQRRSIAERMSWASRRQTSRPEDMAYCLMGIFSVYMPMLYGEGERAFLRLQEEIIKISDDHSIFAWRDPGRYSNKTHGLLADRPSQFTYSTGVTQAHLLGLQQNNEPFSMTNRGLQIHAHLCDLGVPGVDVYVMTLNCSLDTESGPNPSNGRVGVILHRSGDVFSRVNVGKFVFTYDVPASQRIFVGSTREYVFRGFALPTRPAVFRYSLCPEDLPALVSDQLRRERRLQAKPLYLSHVDSRDWDAIGWTVSWDWKLLNAKDYGCVYLQRDDGCMLTVQLGLTCLKEDSDPDAFYPGAFHAEEGLEPNTKFFELAKAPGEKIELKNHTVGVTCDPVAKAEQSKRRQRISPVFVLRVWESGDIDELWERGYQATFSEFTE